MKKLVTCMLLALPTLAAAEVQISPSGDISTEVCVYGRGEAAIGTALAEGGSEILEFIRGSKVYADNLSKSAIAQQGESIAYLERMRNLQQGGMLGNLPLRHGRTYIQGNDTCVEVILDRTASLASTDANSEVQWSDADNTATVIVTGEGWANGKQGLTARQAAEQDALRRAVSQVVGVWITQQRSQFTSTELALIDGQERDQLRDIISQQLHSRSSGMVKEWKLLNSKQLANSGVEVTIQAVVERNQIVGAGRDILAAIGSPRVKVTAPDSIRDYLMEWLSDNGIETDLNANLVVEAQVKLLKKDDTCRLDLSVVLKDLSGNRYSLWQNDSSLVALPNNTNTERNLVEVHLAVPEQADALKQSLHKGFSSVVASGGLVHYVTIAKHLVAEPDKVQALMATIGGASDVATRINNNNISVSLRFADSTGNLAAAIEQSLQPILAAPLPKPLISSEFKITYR